MKIAAAILAGGQSRRMGRDKANLPSLDDRDTTLLCRTVALAQTVFQSVYIVGRFRPDNWPASESEAIFLSDDTPELGPAGGLATVLRVLDAQGIDAVALIACDMPLLTASALQWLNSAAQAMSASQGLVTHNGEQIEPLFAVYKRDCLPLLNENLARGKRSLQKLIEAGDFSAVTAPPEVVQTLLNVNTVEDLAQARSRAETLREGTAVSGDI